MTSRRRGLGARLARLLAGLGVRKERRGKETSEVARSWDRPWGGQSCPDLAQSHGSTSSVHLKVQTQSYSEWDLLKRTQNPGHGSPRPTQPLGRLQRPAVGSACDLAFHASQGPGSLASPVAPAEPAQLSCPELAPQHLGPGSPTCTYQRSLPTAPEVPGNPRQLGNLEDTPSSPCLLAFPMAEGAKGKPDTPGPAQSELAQTLHTGPSARRARYHLTITLQGCEHSPGEEGQEPDGPAPHLCSREESRGWQEPPQGPRPITGCATNPAPESQLRTPRFQGGEAQRQELRAGWRPVTHSRELDHSDTRTLHNRLPGPNMEEATGPPARAEARVVNATLTWRQRPPAQEETRPRFHKVSLVSASHTDASQEMFEHSFRREDINGFATQEEETVNSQGPRGEAGSLHFQSHGPIFSKKYIPPPKEKRPVGRLKEAKDWGDGSPQAPRNESLGAGAMARTELLVPLPGPREPSPHPGVGVSSGSSRNHEEWRVTRTVQTTTIIGGHVDRRSSVTVGPTLPGEALSRGRNVSRTVRAVVVSPGTEGSPSRSQALELLSSLVPAERSPPASHLLRPTSGMSRSSSLGGTKDTGLGQLPETRTAELKDSSVLTTVSTPGGAHPPPNRDVPSAGPDHNRDPDARASEPPRRQRAFSPNLLSLQTQTSAPSSSTPKTSVPSPDPANPPEKPVLYTHPRIQPTPQVKRDTLAHAPAAPTLPRVSEVLTESVQAPAPSSLKKNAVLGPEALSALTSSMSKCVQDSEHGPVPGLAQKEALQGPVPAKPLTQKEVVQGPEAPASLSSKPPELIQVPEDRPVPSLPEEETVQSPAFPAPLSPKQNEDAQGSEGISTSSLAPKERIQSHAVPLTPSSSVEKVSPSTEGPPVPAPKGADISQESQPVPSSGEDQLLPEPLREEDEVALAADLEIFLDTLRNMEPPEILRTHRLPRAPRSSYLAMYATLPAIEEDQPGPWVLGPGPQEVPVLEEGEEEKEEEEEQEPENPYLSDDEKLQRRQEKADPRPSRDPSPAKPAQASCSPLDMMKKHVANTKGPNEEPGLEIHAHNRPSSRLGGSLLFGNMVPAIKEAPTLEPLGAKLSALPPHRAPGLRKGPGHLSLLCSGRPPPEKPAQIRSPEGWSPALKIQGKLNTRPGKVIFFSEPGCQGHSREIWGDIADASAWAHIASIRVVRGCWMLYEQPEFQGRKLVLPEGDMELRAPAWATQGIGSLRRIVQDYCAPEISLFSEVGLSGEQVKFTEAVKDAQGLEKPLKVASATVSTGLWLLYPKSFFEDTPYILEPGEYPTLEAWGTLDSRVGSLKPMQLGCPSVEKPGEPKAVVYEAPDFQGRSWEVSRDIYNLQQPEDSQSPDLVSVGSLRILGGCWVGYEKEGFRGHQYLLEEGEYPDWSHWGGYDELLTSLRVIRTDFGDPAVVLFEAMDFEGRGVEVSSALPDVELAGHGPHTQAIHVLSGVWVAYEQVGFSGEQYVLEKGVYRNCDDWGSGNSALASLQPVLQVGEHDLHFVSKIQLFSGPNFLGEHFSFEDDQPSLPPSFQPQSCRVHGASWILFDEKNFEGEQHILSEGEFPTLTAMGCLASTVLGSLRKVPLHFSEPAIFLYGLECFEGKEIELRGEVRSLQAEGFNNHVLSVRIKGGIWVLFEHSDFRGRQWLVGSCEITNWLTYSGTQRVGSLYPIKQRRAYFRLWNSALGGFLAVPDHVEDMKAGRVVVSGPQARGSCIWFYEDGLLKNQVAPTMSLQVIGPPSPGSKVVLWAESRLPHQTWSIDESGHICSQLFEGQILDVKGGRGYDRDHVVLWEPDKDRASQIWAIRLL